MRMATLKIRHKATGRVVIVNECDWARDLGRGLYNGWERVGGETHGDKDAPDANPIQNEPKRETPIEMKPVEATDESDSTDAVVAESDDAVVLADVSERPKRSYNRRTNR